MIHCINYGTLIKQLFPCPQAANGKYYAVGTSHGLVLVFGEFNCKAKYSHTINGGVLHIVVSLAINGCMTTVFGPTVLT